MKYKKKMIPIILLLTVFLGISFTAAAAEATVAVTIVPQIEMIEAIAGERVEVVEMIPKGFSPSNYAPSPAEMRAFNEASIYFSMGVPADMQNILPRAEAMADLEVVKLFEEVEEKYPHRYFGEENDEHVEEEGDHEYEEDNEHQGEEVDDHDDHNHAGGRDPHIWLSPSRGSYMVEIMRDKLIELLPEYEAEFNKNITCLVIFLFA